MDAAAMFTSALSGKIGITYSTGDLSLYMKDAARRSGSYGIMANLGKLGQAGGAAATVGAVALDATQGHHGQATLDAGLGYAAYRMPAIGLPLATGALAFDVGKMAQNIPSGNKNGDTIGQAMEKGTQGLVAPSSVEWRPLDVPTRTENGIPY
jgi:hypothetical protein